MCGISRKDEERGPQLLVVDLTAITADPRAGISGSHAT
jgi:hypothetical protein